MLRFTGSLKPGGASSNHPHYEDSAEDSASDTDPDDDGEDRAETGEAPDPEIDSEEQIDHEEDLPAASLFVKRLDPQVLNLGPAMAKHPEPALVETHSLASVTPPPLTYSLRIWDKMVAEKRLDVLSGLQLEAIAYACQSHEQMLGDGQTRTGFALGDGTGMWRHGYDFSMMWGTHISPRRR